MLGANEFLVSVIEAADEAGWPCFSSNHIATRLGYSRPYVQRVLSRLRKRGLLRCLKVPRTVRGGFTRGIYNMYYITLRGRERANWWRRHQSVASLDYLATGKGNEEELATSAFFTNSRIINVTSKPWRLKSRNHTGIFRVLAALDPDGMEVHLFSGERNTIMGSITSLKQRRIIPEEILDDPAFYQAIARRIFGSTNTQILIALLFRSLIYWKEKAERPQASNQSVPAKRDLAPQLAHSYTDAPIASQNTQLENEMKRQDNKLTSALIENISLQNKLANMQQLALNTIRALAAISNQLQKIKDPTLAPIQSFINTCFTALTEIIIVTSGDNYATG